MPIFAAQLFFISLTVGAASPTAPVSAQKLQDVVIFPEQSAPAVALSLNRSDISAEIQAVLIDFPHPVTSMVKQGDVLARLNCLDYELEVQRAQTQLRGLQVQLNLATKQLRRTQSLRKQNNVSESLTNEHETNVEQLSTQVESQRIELSITQRNVEKCTLRAPFHGAITQQFAFIGESVSPGQAILHFVDIEHLVVATEIPMSFADRFMQSISTFETTTEHYALVLPSLTPVVNQRSRTQQVWLQLAKHKPLPGTPGRVNWRNPRPHIPAHLLVKRDQQIGIFLLQDNHAHFHSIATALDGRPAEISGDLQRYIIIDGRHQLQDQMPVKLYPKPPPTHQ